VVDQAVNHRRSAFAPAGRVQRTPEAPTLFAEILGPDAGVVLERPRTLLAAAAAVARHRDRAHGIQRGARDSVPRRRIDSTRARLLASGQRGLGADRRRCRPTAGSCVGVSSSSSARRTRSTPC